jgi:hypothetical protein
MNLAIVDATLDIDASYADGQRCGPDGQGRLKHNDVAHRRRMRASFLAPKGGDKTVV